MYLGALGIDCSNPAFRLTQACAEKKAAQSLAQGSRDAGRMNPLECLSAGGVAVDCTRDIYTGAQSCRCLIAAPAASSAPAPAPVTTVTVSPTIATQVSPQISPVFQQQFQPSNSPATAGTTQTSAAPSSSSGSITQALPQALPAAPAPSPAPYQAAPAVEYPVSAPQQLPASPLPSTVTETAPSTVPVISTAPAFDWKIAAILGAGVFGILLLNKRGRN